MQKLLIIGLGETAEHVCRFVNEYQLFQVIGFAVDKEYRVCDKYLGYPVYAIDEIDSVIDKQKDFLFVAMLWNHLNGDRRRTYERLKQKGYKFANLISPTAKIRGLLLGDNCWFHDFSIVQYGAEIGTNVIVMAYSIIGAKTHIGSHCFLGAKSDVAGECTIGEQCFIGISAVIFDARIVGDKCLIGACATVKRDLPNFAACISSSDNVTIKQYSEDIIESKLQYRLNKH